MHAECFRHFLNTVEWIKKKNNNNDNNLLHL